MKPKAPVSAAQVSGGTHVPDASGTPRAAPRRRGGSGRGILSQRTRSAGAPPPIEPVDPALGKTYFVIAVSGGCPSNLLEAAAWREHFRARGYGPADSAENADVIVVNTCAVRLDKEDKSARIIQDFQDRFGADKRILVTGCLEGINPDRLREVFQGETIHPPEGYLEFQAGQHQFHETDFGRLDFKHKVLMFMRRWYFQAEQLAGRQFQPLHNLVQSVMVSEKFYLLTVAVGCLGHCTYCGIRNAKGPVQSRPLDQILDEFDRAIANGYKHVWLIADDLGCWGQDLGSSLPKLLAALVARPGDFRLVINYLGPQFLMRFPEELAEVFQDPRIILVNIPIQSGSPAVLKRMGRDETIDGVLAWIDVVKRRNPSLVVKTNVMVGFPGETWRDLSRTWRALMWFDAVVALRFSARPNTPAETLPGRRNETDIGARLLATQAVGLARHVDTLVRSLIRGG